MRAAAARAASRRGSRTRILLPAAHGSAARTSGTRVVLPAPGGATSTAVVPSASAATRSGVTASIGSGASAVIQPFARPVSPQKRSYAFRQDFAEERELSFPDLQLHEIGRASCRERV